MSEAQLHQQVVNYLKTFYPDVPFRTDFAAGIKMTLGQAVKHSRLQYKKSWPDLFIGKPKGLHFYDTESVYCGLFIELKAKNIYLKDGSLSKQRHIQDQNAMLKELRDLGYMAEFAVGFEQAKELLDNYLS